MDNHNLTSNLKNLLTDAGEMYLLMTVRLADETSGQPVPLSTLAQTLAVQPVSANQMVHSLEEAGLLTYQPYKGVQLTSAGEAHARQILRYRRLWQTFLVDVLTLEPSDAEDLACEFEHATTTLAADRLEAYLSSLESGVPIQPPLDPKNRIQLSQLAVGKSANIQSLPGGGGFNSFFRSQGIEAGSLLTKLAQSSDGSCVVEIANSTLHLAGTLADQLIVTTVE